MFKRTQIALLVAVPVLAVMLLNLPPSVAARFKLACGAVFLPLFGLSRGAASFMDHAGYASLPRSVLVSELERLRLENDRLKVEVMQGADALAENARLRQQSGAALRGPWNLLLARVVAREPTTWWRSVTIDYGTRDGAVLNQPVVTPDGLVGRISSVGYSHSQVSLVGDTDCGVSALVTETRDNGIIPGGQSTLDAGLVEWTALQHSPRVLAGQQLVTSGLGGVFPKNLTIGQVLDTRTERSGVSTTARIKLAANLDRLEEVFILRLNSAATNSLPAAALAPQPLSPR